MINAVLDLFIFWMDTELVLSLEKIGGGEGGHTKETGGAQRLTLNTVKN